MKKIYIVFDQIPDKDSGGLLVTYINFIKLMKDDYDIKIVSVFNCPDENKNIFENDVIYFSKFNINNRFYRLFRYLKEGQFGSFWKSIISMIYFFVFIPFGKNKSKKIFGQSDSIVIASSPAAAIFLSQKLDYILEIHTNYEYFWGKNLLGRFQSSLIPKPKLALFRNKMDASKAEHLFPSTYIYNFFNSHDIDKDVSYLQDKKNKIIFMGRLHEQKNPLRLIDCAEMLSKVYSNFELDIYGTGTYQNILEKEIKNRKLENNVKLCGFTDDKTIYNEYKVLWLTSKREGFGLVIIEAKANYVPTISVNWGKAVYEVIDDENDGYIVNSNQEIINKTIQIFEDSSLLENLSLNARKNYERKFSEISYKERWNEIINQYLKNIV